jgi:DnaJ domain
VQHGVMMGPVRRLVNFTCALALTLVGFALAVSFFANGGRGLLLMAAGTMLFTGACWLWSDFINATPNDRRDHIQEEPDSRQQRAKHDKWEREQTGQGEAQEWWRVLEVSPNAKTDEIGRSYRRKMQQCHPDRVLGLAPEFHKLAERHAKVLNSAYAEAKRRRV